MNIILTIITILIELAFGYFALFALIGLGKPFERCPEPGEKLRFAFVLPVRNEEKVIGKLIESLQEQDYPKERYDIWVILNNSTDRSGDIARSMGAKVLEADVPVHCKGDALSFAFDKLMPMEAYDAFAIFDTDNVVDPGFLAEMNRKLASGKNIVQGRRVGKNAAANLMTGCYEIFYTMQNALFNHSRTAMGASGSLNGTAWVIRADWIREHGFAMKTMTEDLELAAVAALKGEKIGYAHEAVSYDEYPEDFGTSQRQFLRWSFGQVQCMRHYSPQLTKRFIKDGSISCLNMDLVFLAPVLVVSSIALFLIFALTSARVLHPILGDRFSAPLAAALILAAFYGIVCAGRLKCGNDVRIHPLSVAAFPLFLLTWLPQMIRSLFMRKLEWKPVVHDRAVGLEDVQELGKK
jgi:cellulose synthase/poly-beta-1,6-N-acetylglucosamine synthase-like glycosyltransferase